MIESLSFPGIVEEMWTSDGFFFLISRIMEFTSVVTPEMWTSNINYPIKIPL